jgi:hypothetical protein
VFRERAEAHPEHLFLLAEHASGLGVPGVGAHVGDSGSQAFAERFGFEEIDRQVEQVRSLETVPEPAPVPDGIELVTIAERPATVTSPRTSCPSSTAHGAAAASRRR